MNYSELDLNARINLKGTYEHFVRIAMERFQKKQKSLIYNRVTYKFYKKRSGNDRWVNPHTNELYKSFTGNVIMGGTNDTVKVSFLMYGRFVDMGVGRGGGVNEALYRKRVGADRSGIKRTPKRWYSKTKASQEKRLGEILAGTYGQGFIKLAETLLNNTVTVA